MAEYAHEAINVFGRVLTYIVRTTAYIDGAYVNTDGPEQTFFGTLLPATQADLQRTRIGIRADLAFVIHTKTKLDVPIPAETNPQTKAVILFKGDEYAIVDLSDWSQFQIYKYGLKLLPKGRS